MSTLSHNDFASGAKALVPLTEVAAILGESCDAIELPGARQVLKARLTAAG